MFDARRALTPTNEEISALLTTSNAKIASELLNAAGARVLDIGCGEGKFTIALTKQFSETAGVDVKASKILEAQQSAAVEGVTIDFRVASGQALPWKNDHFDAVVFSNSLHHMPDDDAALVEAMRVLKVGGLLYVMEPVASGDYHEATKIVNDETIVRRDAYEAISVLAGVTPVIEILYRSSRSFANFEEWRDDQIDRDPKRSAKFAENPVEARRAFETRARNEGGRLAFDQVFRVDLLRKVREG